MENAETEQETEGSAVEAAPAIPREVIDALKEKHPGATLCKLTTKMLDGETVVGIARNAKKAVWQLRTELLMSPEPAKKAESVRILFNECVLWPSGTQRNALVEKYPGIVGIWAGEITEISGAVNGTKVEKL